VFLDWATSAPFQRRVLRMTDKKSLVSTGFRPRSTSLTTGNLPSVKLKSVRSLPPLPFGGSRLPKDLRALSYTAKIRDLDLPILASILPSNEMQISHGLQLILKNGHIRIGILGFSFKAGTADLRESPLIEVIERLIGKGYDLRIYDKNVNVACAGATS
jgi:hypothetical protein